MTDVAYNAWLVAEHYFNASLNLCNYGLNTVGKAMSERTDNISLVNALVAYSAEPVALESGRY
jgi:hypothetical protein